MRTFVGWFCVLLACYLPTGGAQAALLGIEHLARQELGQDWGLSVLPISIGAGVAQAHREPGSIRFDFQGASVSWAFYRAPGVCDDPFVSDGKTDLLSALWCGETSPEIPALPLVQTLASLLPNPKGRFAAEVSAARLTATAAWGLRELGIQTVDYGGEMEAGTLKIDTFRSDSWTAGLYWGPCFLRGLNSWQLTASAVSVTFRPLEPEVPVPEPAGLGMLLLCVIGHRRGR